ncbi:MAG: alkaline phosphatase [Dysgonamonadaceae bacterium]|nr:alkaline phosphatase [Dysgonamonadaceae bacterium]MDD4727474.1 alkaline phosphatase [Dysgonamonadaceae bacterium]
MKRIILNSIFFVLLFTILPDALLAQGRNEEGQTYILENSYDVVTLTPPTGKKVKNVILMIGDGMSLMHVYSAWTANRGKLNLDNSQAIGLSKTYCADRLITDSGAGGTALATGQKTNYHYVGVDTEGKPLKSLVDLASENGKSAGIAVTCRLWDATPATFCCHNIDRDNEAEIVADYVNCNADYVFGGGAKLFENREDGRNIFKELSNKGFQIPRSWDEVEKIKNGKVFAVVDSVDTPLPAERGDLLARASLKGIELLNQNTNGFFMMIEGSQIDDYGHFNDLDLLMQETHDFDRTIGKIYEWAAQDGETLVVITADHETGGLTLVDGDLEEGRIACKFSTGGHSGVMVPVYAFGPGSEKFTGIYENTAIFDKIKELLNL